MFAHHDDLLVGHLGVNWTIDAQCWLYWWLGMHNVVEWLECVVCQGWNGVSCNHFLHHHDHAKGLVWTSSPHSPHPHKETNTSSYSWIT